MPKVRSWTDDQLVDAVKASTSIRGVLLKIGLVPAGGNYSQVKQTISVLGLDTTHFLGKGWNKRWSFDPRIPQVPLADLLVANSTTQSYKLKFRLFKAGIKLPKCEICGWCQQSVDGRIPVELDHINGDHSDNRLENLRILCPNCHSMQATHRGKNKRQRLARVL